MRLSKPSIHCRILLAILAAATIHPPVVAQEALTPGHEERDIGVSLYKQGNTESAIKALSNAVKKDKLDADAWYFLALACNTAGDPKGARKAFEQVVRLRPNFSEAQTGLAYSLFRLRKMKEAVAQAERALNMRSGLEEAHYVIGAVRLQQDSYLAASQQADAALNSKPNYPPALLLKSQSLFRLSLAETSSNQSLANSKEAADLATKKPLAYLNDAAIALEQYIRLQPNDKDISVWQEQLETIRAYANEPFSDAQVLSGKDVTTKAIVTRKPEPQYTELARGNGVTGTVILRAVFADDGTVKHIRAVRSLPDGLTVTAIVAARKIKFVPATKDGRPVSMYVQLEYNYHLY